MSENDARVQAISDTLLRTSLIRERIAKAYEALHEYDEPIPDCIRDCEFLLDVPVHAFNKITELAEQNARLEAVVEAARAASAMYPEDNNGPLIRLSDALAKLDAQQAGRP